MSDSGLSTTPQIPRKHIKSIQGLRGLAVLLVILAHVNSPFSENGFVGVDIFFVISGFLITRHMVNEYLSNRAATNRQGWISFTGFYLRRARKIIPAAFFVIAGTFVVGSILGISNGKNLNLGSDATWALFFLANLNFMAQEVTYFGVPTDQSPFLHYWSLSVEEQFYMLWPLFFMTATSIVGFKFAGIVFHWKNRLRIALFLMISMSLFIYCYQLIRAETAGYYSSLGRFWEFGVGAILALGGIRIPTRFLKAFTFSMFSITILAFFVLESSLFRYWIPIVVVMTGFFLSQAVNGEAGTGTRRFLENKPILYFGKISFSLYLVHFPVVVFFQNAGIETGNFNALYIVPLTFLLGAFVYREVEARFMKLSIPEVSKKSAARRTRYFALNKDGLRYSCIGVLGLIFFLNFQQGSQAPIFSTVFKPKVGEIWIPPKSYSESQTSDTPVALAEEEEIENQLVSNWNRILVSSLNLRELPSGIQPETSQLDSERLAIWRNCLVIEQINPSCNSGSEGAKKKTYIFGDSYALALSPMVFDARSSENSQVVSWIRGQCTISSAKRPSDQLFRDCLNHRNEVYSILSEKRPYLVIASSLNSNTHLGSEQDLYDGLLSEYQRLVKLSDNVIVIGETPFGVDPRMCPGDGRSLSKCLGSSLSRLETRLITEKAAKAAGAIYLDITSWLCINGKCPVVIDGALSTYDGGHLTKSLSQKLSPLFKAELIRLGLSI